LKFGGVPSVVTTLEFGDLWGTCDDGELLCIERKTPTDLLGSIKDGRVFQQCAGIRRQTPWAYVVITGALAYDHSGKVIADDRQTGWAWDSVQGALLSIQELGVSVVTCAGDSAYEETVLRLARREHARERVLEPVAHPRIMSPAEVMLTSLPGIGFERAQLLLKEFDNRPALALSWLTWHGTVFQVAGIGEGVKQSVRKALKLADDEELSVFTPNDMKQETT
jgi:ERCC4-type nuclease